jgi:hypothetical protein
MEWLTGTFRLFFQIGFPDFLALMTDEARLEQNADPYWGECGPDPDPLQRNWQNIWYTFISQDRKDRIWSGNKNGKIIFIILERHCRSESIPL